MSPQQILEESIEKMGVWFSVHPTKTLILSHRGERVTILPYESTWQVNKTRDRESNAYQMDVYTHDRVDYLVHDLLKWKWRLG